MGMRNYNAAFIEGTSNLRTSSFKDHASTEMHSRAMLLHKKQVANVHVLYVTTMYL